MQKLLVLTDSFPPQVSGASTILGNLFQTMPQDSYMICTYRFSTTWDPRLDASSTYPCRRVEVGTAEPLRKTSPRLFELRRLQYLLIPAMVWQGWKAIRSFGSEQLLVGMTATGGGWLVAGYLLHKLTGKALAIYGIDLYQESVSFSRLERALSGIFEPLAFRAARRVFVISEALREVYRKKYQIEADLLPIPITLTVQPTEKGASIESKLSRPFTVVFTGLVYDACQDALVNLANAVNQLPKGDFKLFIGTPRDKAYLESIGIRGENIESRFISRQESVRLQQEADALFLPQAFNSVMQPVVNTLFPTKTVEYLVSGTPILVHAPPEAQIAQYAKQHGFALLVEQPSIEELKNALLRMKEDQKLRKALVERAWETAKQCHDATLVGARFQQLMTA